MTKDPAHSSDDQLLKSKVERMGVFLGKYGYTPMKARVLAYLLVAEPPYQDFFEIKEFLSASKSSISNALNQLMNDGQVDYITFSGDRRRYFRVNTKNWLETIKGRLREVTVLRGLLQNILEGREDSGYPEFNDGLQEIIDFQGFIAQGIEMMIGKWEEREDV